MDRKEDGAALLPQRISDTIRERIFSGEYAPGQKLLPIRKFAEEFSVCPVTILKALEILQDEQLIERIPVRGIFVSDRVKLPSKTLNACFAFPGTDFSPDSWSTESWGLNSELYRGLFAASQTLGINFRFAYFKENPGKSLLRSQIWSLREYDFVIFAGFQLPELQKASAEERLTFTLLRPAVTPASPKVIRVDYDRRDADEQLLEFFRRSGCERAAAVSIPDYPVPRAEVFLENVRKIGKNIAGDGKFCLDREEKNPVKKLKKMLSERKPDFVFCDFTDMIEYLYEAALGLDLKIGKDVIFCGIGSGLAFQGMFPRMSYFKIPRYEIGRQIVIQAEKAIREHRMTVQMPRFQVRFIEKK